MTAVRYALRSLSRSKGFVAVAVLSLALALGLNTTVFAVLDSFVHYRVPFRNPDRMVRFTIFPNFWGYRVISYQELYSFVRQRQRFVSELPEWRVTRHVVETPKGLEDLLVADVSSNFFRILDVAPERGRLFSPVGENDVAVVSHRTWLELLRRAPMDEPISVWIDGRAHEVVGVMPEGMNRPYGADVWRPLPPNVSLGPQT